MIVYFLKAVGLGRIKIGTTHSEGSLRNRITMTQMHCPVRIELLGTVRSVPEKTLHRLFATYRTNGEWFYASNPLAQFILTTKNCSNRTMVREAMKVAASAIKTDPMAERYKDHRRKYELQKYRIRKSGGHLRNLVANREAAHA